MEYRRLGGSGVKVSRVSLGSWLTYGGSVAEERARACIHKAYELGINFFDTANAYMRGAAEEIVGRALKGVERHSYVVSPRRCSSRWAERLRPLAQAHNRTQCHASLERLGVDYVDLTLHYTL